jgi:hypothetical protein
MLNAALARHAHQDLHKLHGVRRLRYRDKVIYNGLATELMEAEFTPRDVQNLFAGNNGPSENHD